MLEKLSYEDLEQEVRRLHKELDKKESDLREIQKLASIGNWEWNIEQQSLIWSDEVFRIFGFEPSSFKPTVEAFEATIHPDDIKSFLNQRETMLNEKMIARIDHRIVRPDGSIRYVQECTQLILNEQNEVCRVIGTVQDITSRKRNEEELTSYRNHLAELVELRTFELKQENTKCRFIEELLKKANDALEQKTVALEDINTALKVLLHKREQDTQEMEEKIFCNYEKMILPFLNKLKNSYSNTNQQNLIDILETNLKEIISPFSKKLSNPGSA